MEDLLERQENEITVLKSIYANDFADLRKEQQQTTKVNVNKTPTVNHGNSNLVRITLYPQKSQSQDNRDLYVQIDLKVKITPNYPNELPKLTLENEKGLSTEQIRKLHKELTALANNLLGREMIFELCQHVEDYLYQNNKPPAKSFYEQRLESKANFEKEELDHELFDEDKQCDENILAQIDFAVDLKRRMLTEERKKEKEIEKRDRLCSTNSPSRLRRESLNISDPKEKVLSQCVISKPVDTANLMRAKFTPFEIEFSQPQHFRIKCIKLLRHINENSFSAYLGIDLALNELINVYEWRICLERNRVFDEKKLEICLTEMSKFDDEFKRVLKLNSRSLLKYLAYKYYREANKNFFTIQVCWEYIDGYTIDFFVNQKQTYTVRDNTIKSFAIQILNTLEYLHVNNIIHKEINLSSIHLEKRTNVIKLSDYSLVKRLNDLNEVITRDTSFDNIWKASVRTDLHQLGLVLLSLRMGEQITEFHPKVPANFPPEIKEFITICVTGNDGKQIDCKLLRMHKFIQGTITEYDNKTAPVDYDEEEDNECCLSKFNDYPLQSRLNTEFEVIGVLGQGGFGEVLKVKNKLDSRFYAIKRIRIDPSSRQYNRQIIREIKLLSRLNHENVVRYYSTWAERYEGAPNSNDSISKEDKRKASLSQEHPPDPSNSLNKLRELGPFLSTLNILPRKLVTFLTIKNFGTEKVTN